MSEEHTTDVQLSISNLSGAQVQISTSLACTVGDLKDMLKTKEIVTGLFAFSLMMDCGTLLKNKVSKLSEYGVKDGDNLLVVKGRTRDYSKISKFDQVIVGFQYPQGLCTTSKHELLVCYWSGEVRVFDHKYELLRQHMLPTKPPTQLALAATGELLIAFNGAQVGVFDPQSECANWSAMRWLGERMDAKGLAVSGDRVFVSDSRRGAIRVFTLSTGALLCSWDGFSFPCGLAVVEDRLLAVADRRSNLVRLLNFEGQRVADIGSTPQAGGGVESDPNETEAPSTLSRPNDVEVDPDGNILVLDTDNERIAVFDTDGSLLTSVMPKFFQARGNTYSYLTINQTTGAIAVSFDDEHKVVILAPLFPGMGTTQDSCSAPET